MLTVCVILLAVVAGLLLQAIDRLDAAQAPRTSNNPSKPRTPPRPSTAALKAISEKPYLLEELRRLEYVAKLQREQIRRTACNPSAASSKRLKDYTAAVKALDATNARADRIRARLDYIDALSDTDPP